MEANGQRDSTKTSSRDKWWNCPRGSNERVRKILLAEQNNRSSVGRSVDLSVRSDRADRGCMSRSDARGTFTGEKRNGEFRRESASTTRKRRASRWANLNVPM